jgi:hypothetical protein
MLYFLHATAIQLCASQQGGTGSGDGSTNRFLRTRRQYAQRNSIVVRLYELSAGGGPINAFAPAVVTLKGVSGDRIFVQYSGRLVLIRCQYHRKLRSRLFICQVSAAPDVIKLQ